MDQTRRHRRWRRTRRIFSKAWLNRNADIPFPANPQTARELRCLSGIFRNEIRKSAWRKLNRLLKKFKPPPQAGVEGSGSSRIQRATLPAWQ
jgi:hypothetical protein